MQPVYCKLGNFNVHCPFAGRARCSVNALCKRHFPDERCEAEALLDALHSLYTPYVSLWQTNGTWPMFSNEMLDGDCIQVCMLCLLHKYL